MTDERPYHVLHTRSLNKCCSELDIYPIWLCRYLDTSDIHARIQMRMVDTGETEMIPIQRCPWCGTVLLVPAEVTRG